VSGDADDPTIAFYDETAGAYADWSTPARPGRTLAAFMDSLPPGGSALDLGCGAGWAAGAMAAKGFAVEAMDASARLAEEARRRHGISVRVARFEDLDAVARYDGVWALFSLLHMPKRAMPGVLARVHAALKPGGRLYLGLKAGDGEGRDRLGRFYAYYRPDEITGLLQDAGFGGVAVREFVDTGFEGGPSHGLHIFAARDA
jgi:SAM-dependent methyltransferase